jgi:UDPglucose 6-dehydrogenase
VNVHDPKGLPSFREMFSDSVNYFDDMFECLSGADIAIIITEWNEYRNLDLAHAGAVMNSKLLMDARNVLDPDVAREAGFQYHGTGR